MNLTVQDVLDARELGLELLTAHETGPSRPVRGAHGTEIDNPTRWVPPDWIMLTNGLRVRGRADEQRKLVADLAEGGQAALGWAVGLVLKRVPRAILDEAERRDFPVFLVPVETGFHEIIALVGSARMSDDLLHMRRLLAMEDYMMDALRLPDPHTNVLVRLSSLLEVDVARCDARGEPLEVVGNIPTPDLRRALDRGSDAARDDVVVVPIDHGDGDADLLVVLPRRRSVEPRLARLVARRAAQMLGLITSSERVRTKSERAHGAELLRAALEGVHPSDAYAVDGEARTMGIDWSAPVHVVVWEPEPLGGRAARPSQELEAAGLPHLLSEDGQPVALVQADDETLADALATASARAGRRIGVGRPIASMAQARTSFDDARIALAQTHRDGDGQPVVRYDELDPVAWLVANAGDDADRARLRAFLDPLRDQPELMETLRTWLHVDCNTTQAAALLHLHRNSMNYRLARVQEELGAPLKSPRTLANLQAALMAEGL